MTYILFDTTTKAPLSYYYPNGNGETADVIGSSWKSFSTYPTLDEAIDHLVYLKRSSADASHWSPELRRKVRRRISNLSIRRYEAQ